MQNPEELNARLAAIERALATNDVPLTELADAANRTEQLTNLETAVDTLDERVTDLEAGQKALRGYVGAVRAVNRDVERRANAALGAVDRLEDYRESPTESPPVRFERPPVEEDSPGWVARFLSIFT